MEKKRNSYHVQKANHICLIQMRTFPSNILKAVNRFHMVIQFAETEESFSQNVIKKSCTFV